MDKAKLLKLIRDSKGLLETATPEQKVKLLKVIREGYKRIQEQNVPILLNETEKTDQNPDYLEEK